MGERRGVWRALGPGLVFAAAAVGVSHLVQSTRAGAVYGLAMAGLIVLANALKYPAFRFGPQYAAATGRSLLDGYQRQGRWALVLYGVLTLATMFGVQAAVTFVTGALAVVTFGLEATPQLASGVLLVISAALLMVGEYRWLDRITRVLVVALTASTVAATVMVLPRVDWSTWWPGALGVSAVPFTAALVGWMPSAIDVAVWQSLWTLEKSRELEGGVSMDEAMVDFNVGYLGTAALALCFMLLGAGVMYGAGQAPSAQGVAFAAQVIGLYEQTLGAWSRPLIGAAALAVMFSTTLAVLDGFPRVIAALLERLRGEDGGAGGAGARRRRRRRYWGAMVTLAVGAQLVISLLLRSLAALVDVATTLSFLTAPALAWLNHRAITSADVPAARRPGRWLRALSWAGIVTMSAFAVAYLWLLVGG